MTRVRRGLGQTFGALRVRNFRLYFAGQIISLTGTWMQMVAQSWLVLDLTGSGVAVGTLLALQMLPVLLFAVWGGLIADRVDKRRLLIGTQSMAGILAGALGTLVVFDVVHIWIVYVFALMLGCINALDNPARQSFVMEMVGADRITNAVALNSVVVNAARVVGPGIAGVAIATIGIGPCFLANSASFVAVITGLVLMRPGELIRSPDTAGARQGRGQIRAALRYVGQTPDLLVPLLMMAVVGTFAYEFTVSLPLLARYTFGEGAGTYGAMSSCLGLGAVIGGLVVARKTQPSSHHLVQRTLLFGVGLTVLSVVPTLELTFVALVATGALSIAFLSMANARLQLGAHPEMRGRVMALFSMAFLGSTPLGAPIVGWVGEHVGARAALALGGLATVAAGSAGWLWLRSRPPVATPAVEIALVPDPELDLEPEPEVVADPVPAPTAAPVLAADVDSGSPALVPSTSSRAAPT